MINEDKFLEIFKPMNIERRLDRKRALKHYQDQVKELDNMQLDMLIESFKATGQHPCVINTDILVSDLEEESGMNILQNAINKFKEYLVAEILNGGDYN